jgi:hypothetical protein
MFGQLLLNKNKIAIVWHNTYYVNFASKVWNLNKAMANSYRAVAHGEARTIILSVVIGASSQLGKGK